MSRPKLIIWLVLALAFASAQCTLACTGAACTPAPCHQHESSGPCSHTFLGNVAPAASGAPVALALLPFAISSPVHPPVLFSRYPEQLTAFSPPGPLSLSSVVLRI